MDTIELRSGTWTILFSDIVGSTAQRSRLGDEAADALHGEVDQLQRHAVASARGRVVKGLGDGIMAVFEGANDAFDAAVLLHQMLHQRFDGVAEPVQLRIGIAIGDARSEGEDVFGTPVVEAARLCAACRAGEIYATDLARLIAGSRLRHSTESLGMLELKGLSDAVPACRVGWEPLPAVTGPGSGLPLPQLLVGVHHIAFAGRDAEMMQLERAWSDVSDGRRKLVLLAGEPGIGKSRLCAELGRHAAASGGVVLYGRCDDELGVPYQPFVEALGYFLDHWPTTSLAEHLGAYPGELVRLAPQLSTLIPGLAAPLSADPETERFRLFDALSSWLDAVSRSAPLVIVLDDLHWATRPTLLLVKHLAQRGGDAPVLLLGTYRDTDLDRQSPMTEVLADLRRLPDVQRIGVDGLDVEGVLDVMRRIARHDLGPDGVLLAARLHAESEGNPFFVGELLRHLADSGVLGVDDSGTWGLTRPLESVPIPEGVREVIGRRVDALPPASNEVLTVAAVIGRDFDLAVLTRVVERSEAEILELLDACLDARIVDETGAGRYRFAHALVRSTLYDELRVTRRARLHERVAQAIEHAHAGRIESRLGELAFHYERGAIGAASEKAVEFACRAGRAALNRVAHHEALARFEAAKEMLEELSNPRLELDATLGLGLARRWTGHPDARRTLFEAFAQAVALGDASAQSEAVLAVSRGWFGEWARTDDERIGALRQALSAIGDDPVSRARLLANLAVESVFSEPFEARRALSDEAVELARSSGDEATIAAVLALRHSAIYDVATLDDRAALGDELRYLADRAGDVNLTFWSGFITWATGSELADPTRVRLGRALMGNAAQGSGSLAHRWTTRFVEAGDALAAGRLDDAERLATEAYELGAQAGEPDAFFYYGVQLVGIRTEQGRLDELADLIVASAAEYPSMPEFALLDVPLLAVRGDVAGIAERFQRSARIGLDTGPRTQVRSTKLAVLAETSVLLGRRDEAREMLALIEAAGAPIACNGLCTLRSLDLARAQVLGFLGDHEAAGEWYAQAVDRTGRLGFDALLAKALAHQSRWMERVGHPDAAATRQRALDLTDALGLVETARLLADRPGAG